MHPELLLLRDEATLARLLAESTHRPILLFKHSRTCGVSAEALDELCLHLDRGIGGARCAMVTVQTHRAVSDAVTRQLGIRHETPQIILVRDGRPIWSASHFRVTAVELARALG